MTVVRKIMVGFGILLASTIALVCIFIASLFYATNHIVEIIRDQLVAIQTGNIQKAYSYTSVHFQKITSLSDYTQFMDQYPIMRHIKKSSFMDREITRNDARIKGRLVSTDGKVIHIEYRFIKEGDTWKIEAMQIEPTPTR